MSPTQARAWIALLSTSAALPAALDQQLTADSGLINFEYGLLSALNVAPELTMRMGELATIAQSPAPRLSKAIRRLESRGLVERAPSPNDGRVINVRLTREGRRAWLQATPPHLELARDTVLADFTDAQLTSLSELLESILGRLDPPCPGSLCSEE